MKILFLCSAAPHHIALANKLHIRFGLAGIVIRKPANVNLNPMKTIRLRLWQLEGRFFGAPFANVWREMMSFYSSKFAMAPEVNKVFVSDINDERVLSFIRKEKADLVLLSGTNLVKQVTIDEIKIHGDIMNLHTGISPYIKGGPNCTNWCLALGRFDLIGNTVMWLDSGIDSGSLICTERTPLNRKETLFDLHLKVMEHAHDLYIAVVEKYVAGSKLPCVDQSVLGEGQTFYMRQWTGFQMLKAYLNFRTKYVRSVETIDIRLVDLNEEI